MRLVGQGLRCERGGRTVFAGVGFAVASGEALAVTGPNGAGKSSLLRLIAGLLRPIEGAITLEGGDPEHTLPEQAHYVGHLDAQKPALTVAENLSFWAGYLGAGGTLLGDALAVLGLRELAGLPVAYLSAGQRRRLALARLLVAPRPIWLLDEPTSALDGAGQARLTEIMADHLAGGGLIVAATHAPLGVAAGEFPLGLPAPSEAPIGAGLPGGGPNK